MESSRASQEGGLSLLTDLYQLTMAQAYWAAGKAEDQACFHLFFRAPPFGGGYTVACGLEPAVEWLAHFRFLDSDLAYLATLTGNDGTPLFKPGTQRAQTYHISHHITTHIYRRTRSHPPQSSSSTCARWTGCSWTWTQSQRGQSSFRTSR